MNTRNIFVGGLVASTFALSASLVDAREMSLATYLPASSSFVTGLVEPWAAWINEHANGEFSVQVFAGGTLGRDPNQQDRIVSSGIADMAVIVPGRNLGAYPHYAIFELPGFARSADEGSYAAWQMHLDGTLETGDDLKVLAVWTTDPYIVHTASPLHDIAGIEGLRLRVLGQTQTESVLALGGVPQAVSITETPEAISRGTLDGSLADWAVFDIFHIGEVATNSYTLPMGVLAMSVAMNSNSYDELSPEGQAVLAEAGEVWQAMVIDFYAGERGRIIAEYTANGQVITEASDEAIETLLEATGELAGAARASVGDAVMDAYIARLNEHRAQQN
ncbi:TRAP transporter substrate-binding protein DctP [Pararhodobacter sp.]|uniref:TRAP transporter substrate-binding protein DctP n=1 Tax=Pararhodobacter sp. TaxID=2127056 RepID=UPI002B002BEC|nr:TRAP transporter substrate-binding protein DctP [Pararhodobacter sp.]